MCRRERKSKVWQFRPEKEWCAVVADFCCLFVLFYSVIDPPASMGNTDCKISTYSWTNKGCRSLRSIIVRVKQIGISGLSQT